MPYSKYAVQYNKETIAQDLKKNKIEYIFMGKYFGARQEDLSLYTKNHILDFEKTRTSDNFQKGLQNVIQGMKKGNRIALMCTEKEPLDCHRAILVGNAFFLEGIRVQHILPDGSLKEHEKINKELLELYYPNRNQKSIFLSTDSYETEEEYLINAYRKRNSEIGYRLGSDGE